MSDYTIQMKKNTDGNWDNLYPLTKAINVSLEDGQTIDETVKKIDDKIDEKVEKIDRIFSESENNILVTSYFTKEELEDIKLQTPLLDHSSSIQACVNDMRLKGLYRLDFPAGHYRFKNINLGSNSWLVRGRNAGSGYVHQTFFHIISGLNGKGFYGSNRNINFIDIHTEYEGTKSDGTNVDFYSNSITDGTFITTSNFYASKFSGTVFRGVDLIDSEFYRMRVVDNKLVFHFTPQKWVRSTTITFNKVYGERNDKIFNVPKASQSKIVDCIFENGGEVGDITDGSWTIDNLYLEKNSGNLDATNSLLTKLYTYSYQGGAILNTQPNVSFYDKGDSSFSWKGFNGSQVRYDYKRPRTVINGTYSGTSWVKLGRWHSTLTGGRLKISLLGGDGWAQSPQGLKATAGETTIHLVHALNTDLEIPNSAGFAYHIGGLKPVIECKVVATDAVYRDTFDIYVKLAMNARNVAVDYTISEGIFIPDVVEDTAYVGDKNNRIQDVLIEFQMVSEKGSLGLDRNGRIELNSPLSSGGTPEAVTKNFLPVNINGVTYNIPLY